MSKPMTALAAQGYPPDITLAHYDKNVLYINWTNPGAYTDFVVQLHDTSGSMHYNQPATGTSATISYALDRDKTYLVSVSALIDGNPGPSSSEVTLIVIPPVISLLQYTLINGAGKLDTSWEAVAGADLYVTSVYTTDGSFKQNILSTTTSSQLESTLDQSKYATANNSIVIGPASCGLAAIIACPGNVDLNYTGQNLRSDWIIPPSLQGRQFTCELYKDSAKLADRMTGDSCVYFNYSLDAGAIYASQVRAENGVVKGPWTKLAQGPYLENIIYQYDTISRLKSAIYHNTTTITHTMDNPGNILAIQNNQNLGEVR